MEGLTDRDPELRASQRSADFALSAFATFMATVLIAAVVHMTGHRLPWWMILVHLAGFVLSLLAGVTALFLHETEKWAGSA